MGGHGTFRDRRIRVFIQQTPDRVTPKLPALLAYQLSLRAPRPRAGAFDRAAAIRGRQLFNGEARCSRCHSGPQFTDVADGGRNPVLHDADETGVDPRYAERSATGQYRTTPLRGLLQHPPYFHDGSAPTLLAVVNHYNRVLRLNLSEKEKADLVEFLKTL
jgi:cytochrome c peroxidase